MFVGMCVHMCHKCTYLKDMNKNIIATATQVLCKPIFWNIQNSFTQLTNNLTLGPQKLFEENNNFDISPFLNKNWAITSANAFGICNNNFWL